MKSEYLIQARQNLDEMIRAEWRTVTAKNPEMSIRKRIRLVMPKVNASFTTIYRAVKQTEQ